MKNQKKVERFSLNSKSTNLLLLTSEKGHEIGEQFTMNLLGVPQQAMNIPEENKKEVFLVSIEIFKKLSKLANAVDKYAEEELRLVEEFKSRIKNGETRIAHHSDVLEGAAEEVLSQAKSTLDVAVKLFKPLYGIDLHTYGDSGDKVIKALRNNVPSEDKHRINPIVDLIEGFKPYSMPIIKLRTDSQHYGNVKMTPLIVEMSDEHKIQVSLPKITEQQRTNQYVEIIYDNIFVFLRDLLTYSFASKFYSGLVPVVIEEKGKIRKISVGILKQD